MQYEYVQVIHYYILLEINQEICIYNLKIYTICLEVNIYNQDKVK